MAIHGSTSSSDSNGAMLGVRQRHCDLGRRLAQKCHEIEAEIQMLPTFEERYERFMGWADDLERRLDQLQESSQVRLHDLSTHAQHTKSDLYGSLLEMCHMSGFILKTPPLL